jgi:hypothetical protein
MIEVRLSCDCNDLEHSIHLFSDRDPEYRRVYMLVHLSPVFGFFKRVVSGFKYMFGYRCKFGDFSEVCLDDDEVRKYIKFLTEHLESSGDGSSTSTE